MEHYTKIIPFNDVKEVLLPLVLLDDLGFHDVGIIGTLEGYTYVSCNTFLVNDDFCNVALSNVYAAGLAFQIESKCTVSTSLFISTFKTSLSVCGSLSRFASTFTHLIPVWRRASFMYTDIIYLSRSALDPTCMWRVENLWLNNLLNPASASELSHPAVIWPLA